MVSLHAPDGNSAWKGEGGRGRKRERHGGARFLRNQFEKLAWETGPRNWSILYCPERPFILLIIHRDQWVTQSYAALAAQTLTKTRLFSLHTSLRWFTSSSGQKGQLTFYSLFSDKGLSTRRLICVDLPKVWCHSQKALNKVNILTQQRYSNL